MEKDLKVVDIGNNVWCGELTIGYDEAGEPVIEKFYGLSEGSVRTKAAEYRAAQGKKRTLRMKSAAKGPAAPVALAVNDVINDTAIVKNGAKNGDGGNSAAAEKAASSVDLDLSGPCKVIPIRGSGEITYVVDEETSEDELMDGDEIRLSGRVADVIILKYAETEFDRVNNRPKGRAYANLKADWETLVQSDFAEKAEHGDMTVNDMCGRWLEEKARKGASEKDIYRKKNICKFYVLPVMGSVLCRNVDRRHVERTAIRMLYRKDNSDKYGKRDFIAKDTTIRIKLGILNDLLDYGWSNNFIPFRLRAQVNIREV